VPGVEAGTRLFPVDAEIEGGIHVPVPAPIATQGHVDHFAIRSARQWASKWSRYSRYEAALLVGSDWRLSVARDLIKAPIAQVLQTGFRDSGISLFGLVWGAHAAMWVSVRAIRAAARSRRPIRVGSFRERPWGWGEQVPVGYLR
jgi:hypothetical protein